MSNENCFVDLTDYSRQIAPFTLAGVKNVGWLDVRSSFTKGEVPPFFLERLKEISGSMGDCRPLVEPLREPPVCDICGSFDLLNVHGNLLPNAELWIPARETIYASPILIIHFVETHGYLPPQEYIDAVTNLDVRKRYVADEVYREKLRQSEWFKSKCARP